MNYVFAFLCKQAKQGYIPLIKRIHQYCEEESGSIMYLTIDESKVKVRRKKIIIIGKKNKKYKNKKGWNNTTSSWPSL
jgi:hypothetical protein